MFWDEVALLVLAAFLFPWRPSLTVPCFFCEAHADFLSAPYLVTLMSEVARDVGSGERCALGRSLKSVSTSVQTN